MGYYITLEDAEFAIEAENLPAVFEALCELNSHNNIKSGGRYGAVSGHGPVVEGEPHPDKWFAWMPWNYDTTCKSVQEIFKTLGFGTDMDSENRLRLIDYDSKTGDEDYFLTACAPYAVNPYNSDHPAMLGWRGEDGIRYRNYFINGEMRTVYAEITWPAPQ